jgi:hypothetical protein
MSTNPTNSTPPSSSSNQQPNPTTTTTSTSTSTKNLLHNNNNNHHHHHNNENYTNLNSRKNLQDVNVFEQLTSKKHLLDEHGLPKKETIQALNSISIKYARLQSMLWGGVALVGILAYGLARSTRKSREQQQDQ